MNTCKTCKHWTRAADPYNIRSMGRHTGSCNSDKFSYGEHIIPTDGFIYWDQESVHADFATGEDFGCIHWSQKQ